MGRAPCCDKDNVKRGPWSPEEDATLINYLQKHGTSGNWISLPRKAGLKRCGKSCRLRWLNYLRPDIKHGGFTEEEDKIIFSLYNSMGSRWSFIASQLPGRTDNDVKNYWNTRLKKKLLAVAGKNTNIDSSIRSKKSNNTDNIMAQSLIPIPEVDQSTYPINPENSNSLFPPLTDMGFEQNYYCNIPQELNLEQTNHLIPLSSTFMELPNFSLYGCDNNYTTITSTVSSLSSPSSQETLMNSNLRSAAVGYGSSLLLEEDGILLPDIELIDQSPYHYEQLNDFGNFA